MEGLHPIICIQEFLITGLFSCFESPLEGGDRFFQVKMQVILCSKTLRITFKKPILAG